MGLKNQAEVKNTCTVDVEGLKVENWSCGHSIISQAAISTQQAAISTPQAAISTGTNQSVCVSRRVRGGRAEKHVRNGAKMMSKLPHKGNIVARGQLFGPVLLHRTEPLPLVRHQHERQRVGAGGRGIPIDNDRGEKPPPNVKTWKPGIMGSFEGSGNPAQWFLWRRLGQSAVMVLLGVGYSGGGIK